MVKKTHDIELYEESILNDFENDEFSKVSSSNEKVENAKLAAKNFMTRDNRINIRISSFDLNMIRRIAVQEGLPYQTLLSSVIHKFAAGRFVESGK